eukprot:scaffold193328_cov51-Attheya_sp.AAC.1
MRLMRLMRRTRTRTWALACGPRTPLPTLWRLFSMIIQVSVLLLLLLLVHSNSMAAVQDICDDFLDPAIVLDMAHLYRIVYQLNATHFDPVPPHHTALGWIDQGSTEVLVTLTTVSNSNSNSNANAENRSDTTETATEHSIPVVT